MAEFPWIASRNALRRFFAGFFEGPRLGASNAEPLRDELIWTGPPETPAPPEPRLAAAPADLPDDAARQLVSLSCSVGESRSPAPPVNPPRQ